MKEAEFRNIVEKVRGQADIVQVIGQRVTLNRHNKAICPFHVENSPSFSVNQQDQYFHCFGCEVGGDLNRGIGSNTTSSKVRFLEFILCVLL